DNGDGRVAGLPRAPGCARRLPRRELGARPGLRDGEGRRELPAGALPRGGRGAGEGGGREMTYEIGIIGSGPAGLSAAARAAELGVSHVLLESEAHVSNTIHKYQKGKHVMAEPRILPLRSSLDFDAGTREEVLDTWVRQSFEKNLNV